MAHFYRTVTSGNGGTKFTLSFWCRKLRNHTNFHINFGKNSSNSNANHLFQCAFHSSTNSNMFQVSAWNSSGTSILNKRVHNTIEDCSSWFHVVVTIDSTLSTAEDRCKIFFNGIRQLFFESTDTSNTNLSQNDTVYPFSTNGSTSYFAGGYATGNSFFSQSDYYQYAHVIACDGYAYEASSFGEFDTDTYAWNFKGFSGSYGTNGFLFKFDDASNLGTDSSGNGNNYSVSGTAYKTTDSPTKCLPVMDNYFDAYRYAPTKGNLEVASTGDGSGSDYYRMIPATQAVTGGKWYWEVKILSRQDSGLCMIGVIETDTYTNHHNPPTGEGTTIVSNHFGMHSNSVAYYTTNTSASPANDGRIIYGPSSTAVQSGYDAFTTDDIIGVALDCDNGKVYWSKNGTWQNSGDPTSGSTGTGAYSLTMTRTYGGRYFYYPAIANFGTMTVGINFGNGRFGTTALASGVNDNEGVGTFEYTIPTGYRALCVQNIGVIG